MPCDARWDVAFAALEDELLDDAALAEALDDEALDDELLELEASACSFLTWDDSDA